MTQKLIARTLRRVRIKQKTSEEFAIIFEMDFVVNRCPIIKLIQEQKTGDKRSQRNSPFKQGEKYVGGVQIGKGER